MSRKIKKIRTLPGIVLIAVIIAALPVALFLTKQQQDIRPRAQISPTFTPAPLGPLCTGLGGYWNLDENTGTSANDSSGNNNTGTLTNSPTWTTGKIGSAVSFGGINDYISVPNSSSLSNTSGLTVSGWVKMGTNGFSTSSSYNQGLIDKGDYQFYLDKTDGKAKWVVNDATAKAFSALTTDGLNSNVNALAVFNGDLYVAGDFTQTGNFYYIAKWDGTSWSALGPAKGLNDHTYTLTVWNGNLYAGGRFTDVYGSTGNNLNHIAKWDGNTWSSVGSAKGFDWEIYALTVWNGNLYAGGWFQNLYGSTDNGYNYIAKWDGTSWSAVGSSKGLNNGVLSLTVWNGNLYAGGRFTDVYGAAGNNLNHIAKWDGTNWTTVGSAKGLNDDVYALTVWNGNLYAGGGFTDVAGANGHNLNFIAKWDGTSWSSLGSAKGLNGYVYTLTVWNGNLYVAGQFSDVYGTFGYNYNNIVRWDGNIWSSLGAGKGFNGQVNTMAVWNGNLYIGGYFNDTYVGPGWSYVRIVKYGTPSTSSVSSTTSSWTAGNWYYLAGTYDSTGMKLYVNGQLEGSATGVPTSLASQNLPLLIGKTYGSQWVGGSGEQLLGTLDDLRIYNSALTATDINSIYNGGLGTACSSVIPTATVTAIPTITPFPTSSPCPRKSQGDANCDGVIDGVDYSIWLNSQCHPSLGQTCSSYSADFNSDGNVDDTDYGIWLSNRFTPFTPSPTVTAVPPPTSAPPTATPAP